MKAKLFTILFLSILAVPVYAGATVEISDGSVLFLYHGENSSDATGNWNYSVANNLSFASGKLSDAISFNGTNSNLIVSSTEAQSWANLEGDSNFEEFSIGGWIYFDISAQQMSLGQGLANSCAAPYSTWRLSIEADDKPRFVVSKGLSYTGTEETDVKDDVALSTSTWYHVVGVFDGADTGNEVKLYVNGSVVATGTTSGWTGTSIPFVESPRDTALGFLDDCGNYWDGLLDEFFFVNNAIEESVIDELYNGGTGDEICLTAGCESGDSFNLVWLNPIDSLGVNPDEHNIGVIQYNITQPGYIRYRFSTSSDFSSPFYTSGIGQAAVLNGSSTWIQGWSAGIFDEVYPTSTTIYGIAQFYTYENLGTLRATSSVSFILSSTSTNLVYVPVSTSTIGTSTLFQESKFSQVGRSKFPFAYVFDIYDIFASTTATSTDISFSLPIGTSTFTALGTSSVVLFSSSTLGTALGGWLTIFRSIMASMVWIWFAMYIFGEATSIFKTQIE